MNWTLISHTIMTGRFEGGGNTITDLISTVGANLILVGASYVNLDTPSLIDNAGNPWSSPILSIDNVANFQRTSVWLMTDPLVLDSHGFALIADHAVAPLCAAAFFTPYPIVGVDLSNTTSGEGSSLTSIGTGGILTPTSNNKLFYTLLGTTNAISGPSLSFGTVLDDVPYEVDVTEGLAHGYYEQPTATPINETWTWTGSANASSLIIGLQAGPTTYDQMGAIAF